VLEDKKNKALWKLEKIDLHNSLDPQLKGSRIGGGNSVFRSNDGRVSL
jgi:hypothetical protein